MRATTKAPKSGCLEPHPLDLKSDSICPCTLRALGLYRYICSRRHLLSTWTPRIWNEEVIGGSTGETGGVRSRAGSDTSDVMTIEGGLLNLVRGCGLNTVAARSKLLHSALACTTFQAYNSTRRSPGFAMHNQRQRRARTVQRL